MSWIPDEIDYAGLEHLDADYVAGYDAKAQVDPTDDIEILTAFGLGPGTTIIDLGAGTGVFSAAAAATGAEVIAVDVSPPMVRHLREQFDDRPNVTVVEAGFLSYRHLGPPVEFAYCRNALHQLPDFWKGVALQRIAANLAPGAIFRVRDLVFDFEPAEADDVRPRLDGGRCRRPGAGLDTRRTRRARAHRVQHVPLALRADARTCRVRDPRRRLRPPGVRRLHVPVPSNVVNRLADETSPYLRQHRDNPVDWYPWGTEAFAAAEQRNVPILLSVGYSACHWCHVMAHECFEDVEVATRMNELFVNVKVDREERPDVDAVYMDAVQALTGRGGWPMTVFMTPDREPFYGGTYFPKAPVPDVC